MIVLYQSKVNDRKIIS